MIRIEIQKLTFKKNKKLNKMKFKKNLICAFLILLVSIRAQGFFPPSAINLDQPTVFT